MWEGWEKYGQDNTCYERFVVSGGRILLQVCISQTSEEPSRWTVQIMAVALATEPSIDYEETFDNFLVANQAAWEQANIALDLRKQGLS